MPTSAILVPKMRGEEIVIDLPHIRLAGLHFGQGRHIVFALHGWLDNAMSFAPLANALAQDDLTIIALDLPDTGIAPIVRVPAAIISAIICAM